MFYKVSRFFLNIIIKCFFCEILFLLMYLEEGNRKNNVNIYIEFFFFRVNCEFLDNFSESKVNC